MRTLSSPRARGGAVVGATLIATLASVVAACGNEPSPSAPPQPADTPSATPAASPPPAPEAAPSASATASASAAPQAPPKSESSGRPAVLKSDPSAITDTFGSSPPSKLELGDKDIATLRIPEGALHTATNIAFKIEANGKSAGAQIGKVYRVYATLPPSTTLESIESGGPPFVFELPIGARKEANLAIGVEDDKGRVKWTIVAPKSADSARHVAIFELTTLPSGWLHVTTKAPSSGK